MRRAERGRVDAHQRAQWRKLARSGRVIAGPEAPDIRSFAQGWLTDTRSARRWQNVLFVAIGLGEMLVGLVSGHWISIALGGLVLALTVVQYADQTRTIHAIEATAAANGWPLEPPE